MISAHAKLSIQRIPLSQLRVKEPNEPWMCFPEKFNNYLNLLQEHPDLDLDPPIVTPAADYPGIFDIENGRYRFAASIIAARQDIVCVVAEEVQQ